MSLIPSRSLAPGTSSQYNTPVVVNLNVQVDTSGNLVVFGEDAQPVQNVITASVNLPVRALYDASGASNGGLLNSLFEFWEPEDALGERRATLSGNIDPSGVPVSDRDYTKMSKKFVCDLQAVLDGPFDCSGASPYSDPQYASTTLYNTQSDFGRLALSTYAHYLFGHVAATAAITNDQQFMDAMLSKVNGAYKYTSTTLVEGLSDGSQWSNTGSSTDADLARRLVGSILSKTDEAVLAIVNQVLGQDASRAMDQDNNALAPGIRHALKFIAGDTIFMNIKLITPAISVGSGQLVDPITLQNKYTEETYTLKITLSDDPGANYSVFSSSIEKLGIDPVQVYTAIQSNIQLTPETTTTPINITTATNVDLTALATPEEQQIVRQNIVNFIFEVNPTVQTFTVVRDSLALSSSVPPTITETIIIKKDTSENPTPIPLDTIVNTTTSIYMTLTSIGDKNTLSYGSNVFTLEKINSTQYKFTDPFGNQTIKLAGEYINYSGIVIEFGSAEIYIGTPEAPIITGVSGEDLTLKVYYTAPSDGGSAITTYYYSLDNGTTYTDSGSTANPLVITTDVANGTTYQVKIKAYNTALGPESNMKEGTPMTVPDAPTITDITAGIDGTLSVAFTAPYDGGSPITTYYYSTDNGSTYTDASGTANPIVIQGLSNGATYQIKLKAYNDAGFSTPSGSSSRTVNDYSEWATYIGGLTAEETPIVATDIFGNVYIAGRYGGVSSTPLKIYNKVDPSGVDASGISLKPSLYGCLSLTGNTSYDIFLVKYNASGIAQWATNIGGNNSDQYPSLVTDSTGNIYIAGRFYSSSLLINNTSSPSQDASKNIIPVLYGTLTNTTTTINSDIFLAKYDASGQAIWATSFGGTTGTEDFPTLATDSTGNVYIAGRYNSYNYTLRINNTAVPLQDISKNIVPTLYGVLTNSRPSSLYYDIFLVKYDALGQVQWATSIGGIDGSDYNTSIATDSTGNVYIAGFYQSSSLAINNSVLPSQDASKNIIPVLYGTLTNTTIAGVISDIFLAKYDASGQAIWATSFGGSSNDSYPSLATDSTGNVYIAGQYTSTNYTLQIKSTSIPNMDASKNIVPIVYGSLSNTGSSDIFLAKYDASGIVQWATKIGGTTGELNPTLATDATGNVYIAGQYTSPSLEIMNTVAPLTDISNSIIPTLYGKLTNTGMQDIFLAKYDASGLVQWATKIGGTGSDQYPRLATDSTGSIYIAGQYSSSILTLTNNNGIPDASGNITTTVYGTLGNNGNTDIFLKKYKGYLDTITV